MILSPSRFSFTGLLSVLLILIAGMPMRSEAQARAYPEALSVETTCTIFIFRRRRAQRPGRLIGPLTVNGWLLPCTDRYGGWIHKAVKHSSSLIQTPTTLLRIGLLTVAILSTPQIMTTSAYSLKYSIWKPVPLPA